MYGWDGDISGGWGRGIRKKQTKQKTSGFKRRLKYRPVNKFSAGKKTILQFDGKFKRCLILLLFSSFSFSSSSMSGQFQATLETEKSEKKRCF